MQLTITKKRAAVYLAYEVLGTYLLTKKFRQLKNRIIEVTERYQTSEKDLERAVQNHTVLQRQLTEARHNLREALGDKDEYRDENRRLRDELAEANDEVDRLGTKILDYEGVEARPFQELKTGTGWPGDIQVPVAPEIDIDHHEREARR